MSYVQNLPIRNLQNLQSQVALVIFLLLLSLNASSQTTTLSTSDLKLQINNPSIKEVTYKGKKAINFADDDDHGGILILPNLSFTNGTIETEIAGSVLPEADTSYRGFIGIAFRVLNDSTYDCFYIRPTNGRAPDQLRRNHSTQYIHHPEFPWYKLRSESPGIYESYTDLVAGDWTKIKIIVKESRAELYVNGVSQPTLIINKLKSDPTPGKIGLWIGSGTDGYFGSIRIVKEN